MQPDFERTAAAMVAGAQKAIASAVAPLIARMGAAEARVIDLETRLAAAEAKEHACTISMSMVDEAAAREASKQIADVAERLAAVESREPVPGPQGPAGERGEPGADGHGVAGGMINRDGILILTLSDGRTQELGVVVGKDGVDGRDGIDGKSVDLAKVMEAAAPLINDAVAEAMAAVPPAEPGRDGNDGRDADPAEVAKALEPFVAQEIARAADALPVPKDGKDGSSVTVDDVAPLVAGAVAKAVSALPPAEPGRDGKDADMDAVREMIGELTQQAVGEQLADAVKALPAPGKGEPGRDVDMEEVATRIDAAVKSAVAALPKPEPGQDGIGVTDALIDKDGALVLTLSNGATKSLGQVVGKDGKPGETFTLDDFDIVPIDERTLKFCFTRGETMHSFEFAFPVPLDKGVHREGQAYERGDMVSFGGSLWIAQRDTSDKPETSDAWRLAVKRGRDGKPGKDGKDLSGE